MNNIADEFPFLKDPSVEPEFKKILLERQFEERARKELASQQAIDKRAADSLEKLKLRHNTPLVVALVGLITIGANSVVSYFQSKQATANSVTIEQVKGVINEAQKESDTKREAQIAQLKSDLQESAANAEAARAASKDDRQFAYTIIQSELAKSTDIRARATVLLFLVRAGVLNGLKADQLKEMAEDDLRSAKDPTNALIPPTLGRLGPVHICVGNGGDAACLFPGAVVYSCADYATIGGGSDLTYDTFNRRFCQGNGDPKKNVRHNFSVGGGQCGWTSFTVNCAS
ncbi:hypothetical protein [Bradyrhizobium sp. WSM3983]|uniref:hypothetical protein n=1 Tax=Bradyrhizobium sp. WSM3983 TaxID=1038867 RepID=UPI000481A452|nr:hypothetical protein [Bradyrhizobium sp. WSM3983]